MAIEIPFPLTHQQALNFVKKIRVTPQGCWEWMGALTTGNSKSPKDTGGYGKVNLNDRQYLAHRVMYRAVRGPIKDTIDHQCTNRACVRPGCHEDVPIEVNVLRGGGIFAQNARKAACKRGHPFTPENTGAQKGGKFCRVCRRTDFARYSKKMRATGHVVRDGHWVKR